MHEFNVHAGANAQLFQPANRVRLTDELTHLGPLTWQALTGGMLAD